MKQWYKEAYFDANNWILDNYDKLSLNCDEVLLLLLIIFCQKNNKKITYDYLVKKMNKCIKDIDIIIASLVEKHYLELSVNNKGLVFNIDQIFEYDLNRYEVSTNKDIYEIVSDIFGKPLTPNELQKMNDLINEFGQDKFMQALRISEANKKIKMAYIEGILRSEKEK